MASTSVPVGNSGWLAAWIALLATGLYLIFAGGNSILVREVPARIVLQVASAAILGSWLGGAIVRPGWRPTTPLLKPVLVVVAAYILSSLLSQRPRLSVEPTIGIVGFALAFLLLTKILAEPWFRVRAAAALKVLVAAVALLYVVQVLIQWVLWWQEVGAVSVPPLRPFWAKLFFGSPNDIPAFLLLVGPLAVVLMRQASTRVVITATIAALSLLAVFLSGSRAGYLGVLVAFVAAVGLLARNGSARRLSRSVLLFARRHLALSIVLIALFIAVSPLIPALLHRFGQGGDEIRFDLWRAARNVFVDHPITGSGPGTWVQLKVLANPPNVPNNIFSGAHNDFVQAAAELGIVGVAALIFLSSAVARRLLSATRRDGRLALQASAVLVGLVGLAVQCLFENFATRPFIAILVALVIAWIDSSVEPRAPDDPPLGLVARASRGPALPVLGLGAIVLAVSILATVDAAAIEDAAGNDAMWDGDWATALQHYESARRLDPEFTLYDIRASSALARLGRTQEARDLLGAAVELDPVPVNLVGLATLDIRLGDSIAALEGARRAARLGTGSAVVALNAGLVAEAAGDLTFALDQFANAIVADPPLAGLDIWLEPPRLVTETAVIEAAVERADLLTGALILAYSGRTTEASTILEGARPSKTRQTYLAATVWLAGDAVAAEHLLRTQLQLDPLDWFAASWLARIARLSGDQEVGDRYAAWALTVQFDRARNVIGEGSAVPPVLDGEVAGLPASYPSGTYLRETGPYLLMPGLTLIGYR